MPQSEPSEFDWIMGIAYAKLVNGGFANAIKNECYEKINLRDAKVDLKFSCLERYQLITKSVSGNHEYRRCHAAMILIIAQCFWGGDTNPVTLEDTVILQDDGALLIGSSSILRIAESMLLNQET